MTIRVALRHQTTYDFDKPVALSPHLVRLRPAPRREGGRPLPQPWVGWRVRVMWRGYHDPRAAAAAASQRAWATRAAWTAALPSKAPAH